MTQEEMRVAAPELPSHAKPNRDAFELARNLGLGMSYYNSGASRNPLNGFRIHLEAHRPDFFKTEYLVHVRTPQEAILWLKGFWCARGGRPVLTKTT